MKRLLAASTLSLGIVLTGCSNPVEAPAEDAQGAAQDAQGTLEDAQGAVEDAQGAAQDAQGAADEARGAVEDATGAAQGAVEDARSGDLTDQALTRLQEEVPALQGIDRERIEALVPQACRAVDVGGVGAARTVLQTLGLDPTAADEAAAFLDREVCAG